MDLELRFFSALLRAPRSEQDRFWYAQIPLSVFRLHETEAHWVYKYRDKHGRYPSAVLFGHRFEELQKVSDPVTATLEPIIEKWLFSQVEGVIEKSAKMVSLKRPMSEVVAYFRNAAATIQTTTHETGDLRMENSEGAFRRYNEMMRHKDDKGFLYKSPWPTLNRIASFFRPGELVTIAGRPSMGKTYVLLWWAEFLACLGAKVLVVSKEMPAAQVEDRLTAMHFGLPWSEFRAMDLSISHMARWKAQRLREKRKKTVHNIIVCGEETYEGVGLEYVIAKIKTEKPDIVVLDGAYLITPTEVSRTASEVEKLTGLSRANKRIAKAARVLFFQSVQMNRKADKGNGVVKGGMSTVFGADAWAQDTDYLIEVAGDQAAKERVLSIHKARDAAIGDFFINFQFAPRIDLGEKPKLTGDLGGKVKFRIVA